MFTQEEILAEYERRFKPSTLPFFDTFEDLLCHEEGFGLTTASPIQRAVARVVGKNPIGELWDDPVVREAFGGVSPEGHSFLELLLLAGIRSAKSLIAAAAGVWFSQKVDISVGVRHGEIPRFSIAAVEKDNANATYAHAKAALTTKPRLKNLLVVDPPEEWAEIIEDVDDGVVATTFVWHPSGWPIEIRVVAGKRAGGSFLSRYSAGAVLDEAPRMVGAGEGVVNYEDMRRGVLGRILPGGMLLSVGSPWQARGPVYDAVTSEFRKDPRPTPGRCIVRARGPDMNPYFWNEKHCEEVRKSDPETWRTDGEAEFADVEAGLVAPVAVERCKREDAEPILYVPGHDYEAAMDPAFRTNAYTLVIADKHGDKNRVVYAKQWMPRPGEPLRPKAVLEEVALALKEYKIEYVWTDQYQAESIQDLALEVKFPFQVVVYDWTANKKTTSVLSLGKSIEAGRWSLPNIQIMGQDIILTKKRPTPRGVSISYTKTADGRHCDFTPPLAIIEACWMPKEEVEEPEAEFGSAEYNRKLEREMIEREIAALEGADNWVDNRPFT